MNDELIYYINYIEADFNNMIAKVVLKIDQDFIEYNLTEKSFKVL